MSEPKYDETKLPKWAQKRLELERLKIKRLQQKLDIAEDINAVMYDQKRDWFTIRGPMFESEEENRPLFVLDRNGAHPVCVLGKGDLLFVGRHRET